MWISITDANGRLTELVRRAEAGEEIVLTSDGQEVVRLVPVKVVLQPEARRMLLDAVSMSGAVKAAAGPEAARSQDFLYGEDGLPE
jgi:prevent-host-death family protein